MKSGRRKILQDLKKLQTDPLEFAEINANEKNINNWEIIYYGPKDTPYEDGKFTLQVKFSNSYGIQAPNVKFETEIFHMNVSATGAICMSLLVDEWDISNTMSDVLIELDELMHNPDPSSALNMDALLLFVDNKNAHNQMAAEWTQKYAMEDIDTTKESLMAESLHDAIDNKDAEMFIDKLQKIPAKQRKRVQNEKYGYSYTDYGGNKKGLNMDYVFHSWTDETTDASLISKAIKSGNFHIINALINRPVEYNFIIIYVFHECLYWLHKIYNITNVCDMS